MKKQSSVILPCMMGLFLSHYFSFAWAELASTTRIKIMQRAINYANYDFFVTTTNLAANTALSKPGYYVGIPYKRKGTDSLKQFTQGLVNAKRVGNICNKPCGDIDDAVGVDEWGFITNVWGLEKRLNIDELPSITIPVMTIYELEMGDLLLDKGRRIPKLFSHRKGSAIYVYETSRSKGKVVLSSHRLAELNQFKIYRYKRLNTLSVMSKTELISTIPIQNKNYHQVSNTQALLQKCEQAFLKFYLTMGSAETAFTCYKNILNKNSDSIEAKFGLEKIEVYYFARIKSAVDKDLLPEAQMYLSRLKKINGNSIYIDTFNDYFISRIAGQGSLITTQKNSSTTVLDIPYYNLIEKAAKKYDLPITLLASVIEVESSYNPRAVSRSGAIGLMQLKPGTGGDMGVKNLYDPADNIEGGTKYLRKMHDRFKHYPLFEKYKLALTAYNQGPTRLQQMLDAGDRAAIDSLNYARQILNLYEFHGNKRSFQ